MQFLPGLSPLAASYQGFLLDLWGVLHDGTMLYEGTIECLARLRAQDKRIVFLSNAPRRTRKVTAVLEKLGVPELLYDGVLSSGEVGWQMLCEGMLDFGPLYLYIGPERDADVLDGLPYWTVTDVREADFLLNVGFGSEEQSMDAWEPLLATAAARGLPMLCLNPDMEVVKITGERYPCAGVIARTYEGLSGKVVYCGKPYPEVYRRALELLGPCEPGEVLAVGDGLHTDVLGAQRFGLASALVSGGILHQELGDVDDVELRAYLARQDVQPDYVLPGLRW